MRSSSLGVFLVLIGLCAPILARPWYGLTPLHSTRADVEKIWGKPGPSRDGMHVWVNDENHSHYSTKDGTVHVLYAGFTTCDSPVTAKTILWISLTPKDKQAFSALNLDLQKFEVYDPDEPGDYGYKAYIDESDGYGILTLGAHVNEIYYQPTADDRKFCKDYFREGKSIRFQIYVG